jgi:glycosyltransferase involved in cell wall biosynthesis
MLTGRFVQATVVITTKNRMADLAVAIESCLIQTARPEVLVIDDGSTDGTAEMVRGRFPTVRLDRVEQSLGLIVQRNRGAKLASGEVIFSIDDDAAFSTPDIIEKTLIDMDHPRVGAVAIPFMNVKVGPTVFQQAPSPEGVFVGHTYIGTAHALRRELFVKLGGYREFLFHQGEEGDYVIRMMDAGYIVRLGRSPCIHHFESPRRDFRRMDLYGRRNDILFPWYNVPMPYTPAHLLATTLKGLRFGVKVRRPWRMIRGLGMGYAAIFHERRKRRPVRKETYRLMRRLQKSGPILLSEVESGLPAMP